MSQVIAYLTASPFWGGPERQMLGLARAMPQEYRTVYLCMMEAGKARPFVEQVSRAGFPTLCLEHNYPHLLRATYEVIDALKRQHVSVLFTHGYKTDLIGLIAAKIARIPVVMVSRGWTGATARVRLYEKLDRRLLRFANRVVCVSEGQAQKVHAAGIKAERLLVIPNSIDTSRFARMDPQAMGILQDLFPNPPAYIVMAVGRLSPEKGFAKLVEAADIVRRHRTDVGFALIGDGPQRIALENQVQALGLEGRFVLCGFRDDVDRLLPHAACLVQSSYTEGMPNVVLEAMAASVPVVATAVGGTTELVVSGSTGILTPAGDAQALANGVLDILGSEPQRVAMGIHARRRVQEHFTFTAQAASYVRMLQTLVAPESPSNPMLRLQP